MAKLITLFITFYSCVLFAQNKNSEAKLWAEVNKISLVVEAEKIPNSYTALRKIVSNLQPYLQNRLSEFNQNWSTEIYVLDSPMINAFVISGAKVESGKNFVFVTTGAIERSLKEKNGHLLLYGLIAHEMSHPIDDADPNGVSQKNSQYGELSKKINSQGVEILTDANALHMLRSQGVQPSALLHFLETIDFSDESAVSNFIGSHPNDLMRQSAQRILLTLDRLQKGPAQKLIDSDASLFARVLSEAKVINDKWKLQKNLNSQQILLNLKNLMAAELNYINAIEFNRQLLRLHLLLKTKGSAEDQKNLADFWLAYYSRPEYQRPSLLSKNKFKSVFSDEFRSLEFANMEDIYFLIQHDPIYLSENYIQRQIKNSTQIKDTVQRFNYLTNVIPNEILFNHTKSFAVKNFKQIIEQYDHNEDVKEKKISNEILSQLLLLYIQEIRPTLSVQKRIEMDALLFRKKLGASYFTANKKNTTISELLRLKESKTIAEHIWEHRGYYGMLEVTVFDAQIDWRSLARILDLDETHALTEVRHATFSELEKESYKDVLKYAKRNEMDDFEGAVVQWDNDEIIKKLKNDKFKKIKNSDGKSLVDVTSFNYATLTTSRIANIYIESFLKAADNRFSTSLTNEQLKNEFVNTVKIAKGSIVGSSTDIAVLQWMTALAIERSNIPKAYKKQLLSELLILSPKINWIFTDKAGYSCGQWLENSKERRVELVELLIKYNLAASYTDVLIQLARMKDPGEAKEHIALIKGDLIYSFEQLFTELNKDLKAQNTVGIKAWIELLELQPDPSRPISQLQGAKEMQAYKDSVIKYYFNKNLNLDEALSLYEKVTHTGHTQTTDLYLSNYILKQKLEGQTWWKSNASERILKHIPNLASEELKRALVKEYIYYKFADENNSSFLKSEISKEMILEINKLMKQSSTQRDQILEDVAWDFNIKFEDLSLIESLKQASQWKNLNPLLVNMGSLFTEALKNSPNDILQMLKYISNPFQEKFPEEAIRTHIAKESMKYFNFKSPDDPIWQKAKRRIDKDVDLKIEEVKAAILNSKEIERVPLAETLLSMYSLNFKTQENFFDSVLFDVLKYKKDGSENKLLRPYLKIVDKHEITVSLAYLLSHYSAKGDGLITLFEVFQSVGIKFAQMASVWRLFSDDVTKGVSKLKDRALPMSKKDVETHLRKTLDKSEFDSIDKLEGIAGSASIKMVVFAKLKNGQRVVFMIKRPNADEQVRGNIDLSLRYLEQLKKENERGLPAGMFQSVVNGVKEQMNTELNFNEEAKQIVLAKQYYEEYNKELVKSKSSWKFVVPQLNSNFKVRSNLLVCDAVNSVSFNRYTTQTNTYPGTVVVHSALWILAKFGWFNPDQHAGNILVNENKKEIYPIDFGQALSFEVKKGFSYDDRAILMEFVLGLHSQSAKVIVSSLLKMSKTKSDFQSEKLEIGVEKILSSGASMNDKVINIFNYISDNGLELQGKFSFGAIKGLLMLSGESYVSFDQFIKNLKEMFLSVSRTKPTLALKGATEMVRLSAKSAFKGLSLNSTSGSKAIRCEALFSQ